ncbi:ABC-F family ATP-binding cassette domain-containing protein [Desertihabitans aurantiacus]|uniref:ABC-F family ATP-binding cassette domain-containing protein n=1 Tax=Desertihabitans aurantiacus TaxID=2282477 RepID=UPI000DF747A4|nr:ATP-binding cassette domain-containing protein [Desertihabitans aurantiacus]
MVRLGERTVLRGVDFVIGTTDRLAVVGDNGAGKSTLLGALAGSIPLAHGERLVDLPGGVAIAEQHPAFPAGTTVADALDLLLADVRGLEKELQVLADSIAGAGAPERDALMERYDEALDRFEARDGYHVDLRVDAALDQLGLGGVDRRRKVAQLSGGERARLALAAAVSAEAELLLLDEPTNDLDQVGIQWLEESLAAHQGALVVVTHDRHFIDRFASDILAIENGKIRRYGDGYSGYLTARAAERQRALELHRAWQADLARNEALVKANAFRLEGIPRRRELAVFGHASFRARSRDHGAMSRIKMAKSRVSTLRANPAPKPADPLRFTPRFRRQEEAPGVEGTAPALLTVNGVRRGVDDLGPGLTLEELIVGDGDRWLVEGLNGAGKTTLLRVLAGEVAPHEGVVLRRPGARVVWLRQELTSRSRRPLVDAFAAELGAYREDAAATLLSLGLFDAADLGRPLSALSVGQRRRLEVAVAVSVDSDLLLLDEPTNHLSPELTEQLEDALEEYPGAVITVTHDRRWRERAARDARLQRLHVAPGGVVSHG